MKAAAPAPSIVPLLLALLVATAVAAEPAPLADSRKAYRQAVATAAAPLKAKYLARLNQLLQQYTKSGDLTSALAVRKEIQAQWIEGAWLLTGKTAGKTEEFWFDAKGRCSYGTWSNQEGVLTTSPSTGGWWLRFELPKDGKETVEVVSYHGSKPVEKWVMKRLPEG